MFERFTYEARIAVVGAQEVARARGARQITTTHLLVALLSPGAETTAAVTAAGGDVEALTRPGEHGELDSHALSAVGVDLEQVTARAEEVFGPGALARAGRSPKHLPFRREAKKALELALREAVRLQERTITGRHLLLGLIRAECDGRTALVGAGTDLPGLRAALEQPRAQSA
ncbi:Clp protease N-terminal domain-containing protein [Ruania zhangjianzhongii]|uniref:Clp protease N-terminal domain-containing protein n=1 Tax=Ruania zhangjianzhongii TaxID=2603206 RepID=UPI0011C8E98F|nr:Clp protease N-terminal domain-containing protein [Ruania zhangjianzhongii]